MPRKKKDEVVITADVTPNPAPGSPDAEKVVVVGVDPAGGPDHAAAAITDTKTGRINVVAGKSLQGLKEKLDKNVRESLNEAMADTQKNIRRRAKSGVESLFKDTMFLPLLPSDGSADLGDLAEVFHASCYFGELTPAQIAVHIIAGRSLGMDPAQSVFDLEISPGPTIKHKAQRTYEATADFVNENLVQFPIKTRTETKRNLAARQQKIIAEAMDREDARAAAAEAEARASLERSQKIANFCAHCIRTSETALHEPTCPVFGDDPDTTLEQAVDEPEPVEGLAEALTVMAISGDPVKAGIIEPVEPNIEDLERRQTIAVANRTMSAVGSIVPTVIIGGETVAQTIRRKADEVLAAEAASPGSATPEMVSPAGTEPDPSESSQSIGETLRESSVVAFSKKDDLSPSPDTETRIDPGNLASAAGVSDDKSPLPADLETTWRFGLKSVCDELHFPADKITAKLKEFDDAPFDQKKGIFEAAQSYYEKELHKIITFVRNELSKDGKTSLEQQTGFFLYAEVPTNPYEWTYTQAKAAESMLKEFLDRKTRKTGPKT